MTLDLSNAPVFDVECLPNVFTLDMEMLNDDRRATWEISEYHDDRRQLMEWFQWISQQQAPMIAFNSIHYDYPMIHYLFHNPNVTPYELYLKSKSIITSFDKFANTIWASDRFTPQIDLFKIHHFDNKAKTTSLKALQINMRLDNVVDSPLGFDAPISHNEINGLLIPYNIHDVKSTKAFAHFSKPMIDFRLGLIETLGVDVMNYNDTKIGAKILENRLGDELCYDRSSGRRAMRQTVRDRVALKDIIFPYIKFENPEFNRVLSYLQTQVLTREEIDEFGQEEKKTLKTKGVFTGLKAHVGGIDFCFGTGGIHGSVEKQRLVATERRKIRDIDVAALYPSIGIVNKLAPAHLGERFVEEYARLPKERKEWQIKKGKKCVEANAMKLAGNGTYGNTNSPYSVFYDPQYTMTITVNGQLMLCMLAEQLVKVPSVQIIQINTDGITYMIDAEYEPQAKQIEKQWQDYTLLVLEDTYYKRMWIRDVNNYIAEGMDGSLKQKGAYWHPDPLNYAQSISESQPPAWHKDLGNCVSIRAAVAAMVHNVPPETSLALHSDKFDFMCRVKVGRADTLTLDGQEVQRTSRYYVAKQGGNLVKTSPPAKGAQIGAYKRANGVGDVTWFAVNAELEATGRAGQWDARIHTKNKSRYEMRETAIEAGYKVAICNDIRDFNFANVNYDWYVQEAKKLII